MSSRTDLDDLDLEIIRILLVNSRTSYRKIAEKIGVSPATVLIRLRKLRRKGIIRGFTIDLDPNKLGYNVQAYILVKTEPKKTRNVWSRIASLKNVVEAYEVTGEYNILAKVWVEDYKSLANTIDLVRGIDGVVDTNTIIVLRPIKTMYVPL